MKLSKRQDIEAPLATVFEAVSNFPSIERAALRRGIEVARMDDLPSPGPGMAWTAKAPIRGRMRDIAIRLTGYQPATELRLVAEASGITADVTVDLMELSRGRTRMQVGIDLRATTIPARILLQSAKLAKSSLERRFARRLAEFAADIESRQRKQGRYA